MNILLVTQYFCPENFKSNDIAFELKKRGHDVTVLTGLPNYPEGKLYKGYGFFKNRTQYIEGVKVIRALLMLRGNGGGVRLFLNYFSWVFFATLQAIKLSFNNKYDAIIVHEPSPITQGFPAIALKKISKTPIYFWVLDLWPESLQSAGGINNKMVLGIFDKMVKYIYNQSDKILISSKGFEKSILEKGNYKDKLVYFPNWAEDTIAHGDSNFPIPKLPEGFKVLFAGNLGEAQDMPSVLQAAYQLKERKDIHFLILGDGRLKAWIEEYIKKNNLEDTVHLLGRFPIESMKTFFDNSDALLVSLKDELIFNLTVPAKMQAYMSVGKPILTMLNGEGNELLELSRAGLSANAGDYSKLADNIVGLYNTSQKDRNEMGLNAIAYYQSNFELSKCMDNLENIIKA